ncbi:hypothetical protein B0J11DRAFT_542549 [Dendryphion nanum]|uniref:Uncharacterized protein n=1 Tax=Dendryphion nanum TaxID=256645 RepID=A0A9P9D4F3_9PLEO|nr:hypothetical protein B0J11DRAFT_542549 [Dendryphion nanum]
MKTHLLLSSLLPLTLALANQYLPPAPNAGPTRPVISTIVSLSPAEAPTPTAHADIALHTLSVLPRSLTSQYVDRELVEALRKLSEGNQTDPEKTSTFTAALAVASTTKATGSGRAGALSPTNLMTVWMGMLILSAIENILF